MALISFVFTTTFVVFSSTTCFLAFFTLDLRCFTACTGDCVTRSVSAPMASLLKSSGAGSSISFCGLVSDTVWVGSTKSVKSKVAILSLFTVCQPSWLAAVPFSAKGKDSTAWMLFCGVSMKVGGESLPSVLEDPSVEIESGESLVNFGAGATGLFVFLFRA